MRKIAASIAALVIGVVVGLSPAAPAAAGDASCVSGDICLYYGANLNGGVWSTPLNTTNYAGQYFFNCSASNCALNDNAASLWNRARFYDCTLCKDSYYRGGCIDVPTSTVYDGNELGGYANELSSHFF